MLMIWSDVRFLFCLQVQRLAQYEQYFQDYLENTRTDHPDHEHLSRASTKAKQVRKGEIVNRRRPSLLPLLL